MHELSNAMTASIGYTELLQVLTNDGNQLQGETLANVRRYLSELRQALHQSESILADERRGHSRLKSAKVKPVKRRHVLIVDDEPGVAAFLAELMRGRQHKATIFTDGHAALDFFHANSHEIDLAILDQMMPGITGIGLATEMLSKEPTLPVILCTGDAQVIADQQHGKLNIKHFVTKPIDINELTELVIDVLEDD
ncbi:MAG: response regulator [Pseudomonadales bacterium]|nr:response regulator [Pseudomonadales bacterium]